MLLIYHSALDESGAALRRRRRLFRQGRGKSRAAVVWTEAEEGLKLMGNGSRPTKTRGGAKRSKPCRKMKESYSINGIFKQYD